MDKTLKLKEFYETFKIEPATIEEFGELYFFATTEIDGKRYAPIDINKLLKMEDILLRKHIRVEYYYYAGKYDCSCTIPFCNGRADTKGEAFLEMMICIAQQYLDGNDMGYEEEIYRQVQQLFSNKTYLEEVTDVCGCCSEIVKRCNKNEICEGD